MLRFITYTWNIIHRTKITQNFMNLYFIKNFFRNTKNINNNITYFILNQRSLKIKNIKMLNFIEGYFFNKILFFMLFLFFVSFVLFFI